MKLSISARLIISFIAIVICGAGLEAGIFSSLGLIKTRTADVKSTLATLDSTLEAEVILHGVENQSLVSLADQRETGLPSITEKISAARSALAALEKNSDKDLKQETDAYIKAAGAYLDHAERMLGELRSGNWEAGRRIMDADIRPGGEQTAAAYSVLHERAAALEEAGWKGSAQAQTLGMIACVAGGSGALLAALVSGLLLLFSIRRQVGALAQAATRMGEGDFTQEIQPASVRDELGQMNDAFLQMKGNTQQLIRMVAEAAQNVSSASQELSAGADETGKAIQQVSVTVQEVARGSQETSVNLGRAQQSLRQNAQAIDLVNRDIQEVSAFATQAASQGSEGKRSTDEAVAIISHAAGSVKDTARLVVSLGEQTRQIGEFINIITGIADQTNLLALNAAIEAARAGDAGRGFAVVAEEVRKLAEESNTAAGNITKLVKGIDGEMKNALDAMERSDTEVADGAQTVASASNLLSEIVKGVEALSDKVHSISAASQQINASTGEVVNSMESVAAIAEQSAAASQEVSAATQQQTASMEEIAASSNSLAKLAQDLQVLVSSFSV